MSDTIKRIKKVIAETLSVDESRVTPSASLGDNLSADSLDMVELVIEVEKEFQISIPDDDIENIHTVQHVIDYVENAIRQRTLTNINEAV